MSHCLVHGWLGTKTSLTTLGSSKHHAPLLSHQHNSGGRVTHPRQVVATAGKEQKRRGIYFDYERVDPNEAKEIPFEKERLQEEFTWVKRARNTAQDYKEKREKPDGWQRRNQPGKPTQQRQQQQQQTQADQQPSASRQQQAPVQDVQWQAPPAVTGASTSGNGSTGQAMTSRKQQLLQRIKGSGTSTSSSGDASVGPSASDAGALADRQQQLQQQQAGQHAPGSRQAAAAATAATATAAAAAAAAAATGAAAGAGALKAIPDLNLELPDMSALGELSQEELEIKEMLTNLLTSSDPSNSPKSSLLKLLQQERSSQQEYQSWLQEIQAGRASTTDDSSAAPKPATPLAAAAGATAPAGSSSSSSSLPDDADDLELMAATTAGEADIVSYLSAAAREISELGLLAASLPAGSKDDMALDLEEGDDVSDDQVLARLRQEDPELFDLLKGLPGDSSDSSDLDLLAALAVAGEGDSGANDDADISDADWAEYKSLLNEDVDSILDDEDDEADDAGGDEDELDFADLFEAIDEAPDLEEQEKLKATYALQSMFNAPAQEAAEPGNPSKGKGKRQSSDTLDDYDPSLRGMTTTGRNTTLPSDDSLPSLIRPKPFKQ